MKYDFQLDLGMNTSTGKMIAAIQDNSTILEFGPGNGRMTEYLIREKKCDVSIIEFDKELYQHVMTFARDGFLGDIESYLWTDYFQGETFDYILFADVLEHLRDPENTLKTVTPFLKDDGKVLITFPNLAHNAVLIDLFNNKLSWRKYGLLDATHKTFYTQDGFEKVFAAAGLSIAEEDYTFAPVGNIEIDSEYSDLPLTTQFYFRNRPYGEVYQYFFALGKHPLENPLIHSLYNSNHEMQIEVQYLYADVAVEVRSELIQANLYTKENLSFTLNVPENVKQIRLLPKFWSGVVDTVIKNQDGETLKTDTNALWSDEVSYAFGKDAPFINFDCQDLVGESVSVNFDFLYIGDLSHLEGKLINEDHRLAEYVNKLEEEARQKDWEVSSIVERYYETFVNSGASKKEFNKASIHEIKELVNYNIDSITSDDDAHSVLIRGWGYSKNDLLPLDYIVPIHQGAVYTVKDLKRSDVVFQYKLDEKKKYGFEIIIKGFKTTNKVDLIFVLKDGSTIGVNAKVGQAIPHKIRNRVSFAVGLIRSRGLIQTIKYVGFRLKNRDLYASWIKRHETLDVQKIQEVISQFAYKPKISIVVPVYNVEEKWLEACVASLKAQCYTNWELCLADDCSSNGYIKTMLENYQKKDERIKVVFREKNGHISEATNSAISISTGDYVSFMDNDDELAPNALYEVVKALNQDQTIDFLYTDEDKKKLNGERFDPFFKPDWNPTLILGHNYITHYVVVQRDLLDKVGGLRSEFNGSQDYDFVLRATELAKNIYHIPKILYHWRTVETSTAYNPESKNYAYVAGQKAIMNALERRGIDAEVTMTPNYGTYKVAYILPYEPRVSILPLENGGNYKTLVEETLKLTQYKNFEIILPLNLESKFEKNDHLHFIAESSINEQARQVTGEFILFMNNTAIPKNKDWLTELVNYAWNKNVGVVGGKVVNPQDIVLNAGISFDEFSQQLEFDQRGISNKTLGYYFRLAMPRNVYGVTEECLLIRKGNFEKVGGFRLDLPKQSRGIDLSLKVRSQLKLAVLWEPYSILVDLHQRSYEITKKETQELLSLWSKEAAADPYANINKLDR